ncbi:autotransporter outer membrane beta-barrel domain-containing protein [Pontiellaceae bacterium B12227]|nr:autotransporter outer membrane beta-barrel domain-containing protein [Pontiellaceae bacterium B12227]
MKVKGCIAFVLLAVSVYSETNRVPRFSFPRWGPSIKAGSVYDFETDMDGGGSFDVNRYFIEAGIARMWSFDRMIAVSAGFGQDDYQFNNLGTQPWNNIDAYRLGLFARWRLDENWVLFAGPSVRSYSETGTSVGDALTGSFFGGASYRFGDRLTLGPGFVAAGQIEERTQYFPVLLVNWNITERLSLETGGGFAATAGPGLSLIYNLSDRWKAGLSGRYEKKRFRINGEEIRAPNGVGEDRSAPLTGSLTYFFYPAGYVSGIIGYNLYGKLSADDADGNSVYERYYDPTPIVGFIASFRF